MKSIWYLSRVLSVLIFCIIAAVPVCASGTYWTQSYYLYQGQTIQNEIQVNCGAQLVLTSPYGANFDIYAWNHYNSPGYNPSNQFIMANYDKVALGRETNAIYLEPGLWHVVIYARYGNGQCLLELFRDCQYSAYDPVKMNLVWVNGILISPSWPSINSKWHHVWNPFPEPYPDPMSEPFPDPYLDPDPEPFPEPFPDPMPEPFPDPYLDPDLKPFPEPFPEPYP